MQTGRVHERHNFIFPVASLKPSTMRSSDLPNEGGQLDHRFQPIFIWMKILGISLTGERRFIGNVYDLLMLAITLASNIASITLMLVEPDRPKQEDLSIITSYTFTQILYIDNLNFILLVVGAHLMLLCQTRRHWKKLWATLLEVQVYLNRKILNRSFVIALLLIPEAIMIVLVVPLDVIGLPLYQQLVEVVSCATKIYAVSGMILFCMCGWIASDLFQVLLKQLNDDPSNSSMCLKTVKKRYQQVCQLIDDINQCFGFIVLFLITYMMASVVMVCFVAVVEFQHYDSTAVPWLYVRDWILLIQHVINLIAITFIPHTINIQNQQIHLALGRIEIDSRVDSTRHEQLEFLKWDVSQSSVKLTAAGLFDITPRLFPKLIGITMTYVIILFQFQSSEKTA